MPAVSHPAPVGAARDTIFVYQSCNKAAASAVAGPRHWRAADRSFIPWFGEENLMGTRFRFTGRIALLMALLLALALPSLVTAAPYPTPAPNP